MTVEKETAAAGTFADKLTMIEVLYMLWCNIHDSAKLYEEIQLLSSLHQQPLNEIASNKIK